MRRLSREIALQILFQNEFTTRISYSDFLSLFEETVPRETTDYADALIKGVVEHKEEIDKFIQDSSAHWSIARMSMVDRNVLRIAIFEMRFAGEKIKPSIAINEAIEISKKYGTTDSGSFVNGVLDAVARVL